MFNSLFVPQLSVTLLHGKEGHKEVVLQGHFTFTFSLLPVGTPRRNQFDVYLGHPATGGQRIAHAQRHWNYLREHMNGHGCPICDRTNYTLTVAPGVDVAFCVMLVVALRRLC